jgi:hypothetical protein
MMAYYMLFGTFSVVALAVNLLLLISVLSMLQATLTLPGIAAMALALGMAIDSNVLINERIREELRNGSSPQTAIAIGFDKAWATILRLQRHHLNRRSCAVGFWIWSDQRICGCALPRDFDLHVLCCLLFAWPSQPLVWQK